MDYQDRRNLHQPDSGRRVLADRRNGDDSRYNGIEHRSGNDRRVIADRRR